MHDSTMLRMEYFVKNYCTPFDANNRKKRVLDVGSYDVNGTYKPLFSDAGYEYVGLDITEGPNVDIVPNDMYDWEKVENESFDYIVSGQAFEHIEFPWLTINEMKKKLKEDGIICVIAPNSIGEHRYPIDCWRFYSDGMRALASWCNLEVIEVSVGGVPSFNCEKEFDHISNDVCLVACKSIDVKNKYKDRPMFPIERRYDEYADLKLQNEFLGRWKCEEDKINQLIIESVTRNKYNFIYIVGDGYLAIALNQLLSSYGIKCEIIQENAIDPMENNIDDKKFLYIVTAMDKHRVITQRLMNTIKFAPVQYLDHFVQKEAIRQLIIEYKERLKECENIYIYGAGFNGKRIGKILEIENFPFSGFVISDDRKEDDTLERHIYKISEIPDDSAIIVSPYDSEEIYKTLRKRKFKYIIDGLPIVKEADAYVSDKDRL